MDERSGKEHKGVGLSAPVLAWAGTHTMGTQEYNKVEFIRTRNLAAPFAQRNAV